MNVLKGDWYSDKSRIGLGAGWRCRKCGVWVRADQPMVCKCNSTSNATESPTVVSLRSQLMEANSRMENLAEITVILAEQHPEIERLDSGQFRGYKAPEINAALGL